MVARRRRREGAGAAYAAATVAQQAAGIHEQAQLLGRVLEHWDAVPDAEQLVGESRAAVLVRCIAVLFAAGQFEDCLTLIEQEQRAQRDDVACCTSACAASVLEELARDDEDPAAVASLEETAATLMAAPLGGLALPGAVHVRLLPL